MNRRKRPAAFARKSSVIATQVALAAMAAAPLAYAQQAAQKVERIEITGTRIPTPNLESASPVAVMSAEEIKMEGVRNVEFLLGSLPQVVIAQNATVANGATGTATVSLRNLGEERTLVLINGKRMPAGSPRSGATAPDLNQIPAAMIQRVEVLTGGASAVYGSDAVAGVVNFILRSNFEGVQGDVNYSFFNHQQDNRVAEIVRARGVVAPTQFIVPGDKSRDGESFDVSLMLGGNFANNRGNATLFFGFKEDKPLLQSERDYSACALLATGDTFICGGSGTGFPGRFFILSGPNAGLSRTVADASGGVRPWSSTADAYNYGPLNYYQRPSERYSFYANGHFDITPHVRAYGEFGFHDDHTVAQIAPSGSFGEGFTIGFDNPLLSAAWRSALGLAATGNTADILLFRRNVEGGGRQDDIRHTSYRSVLGVKGDWRNWDYDLFAQAGRVVYQETYLNDFSVTRLRRALDVVTDPATGQPACRSALSGEDPNCVPWNVWRLGGVTPEAINYIATPGFQKGHTYQYVRGGQITGDLGNYGWKLPGAKSGIGLAFGAERRREEIELQTDTAFQTGDLAGQGGPTLPHQGSYTVNDYFVEARIPIIEGRRMAEQLNVNASYRYSDYSTDKKTDTYGIGIEYAPTRLFKARASYQQAVRHANVVELFLGQGFNLFDFEDPCGPSRAATVEQCARTGLPANLYGAAIIDSPAQQYNFLQGGNPDLDPEKAKSKTIGLVFTPMRNLNASIDYYDIKIDKVISNIPPSLIVTQCINAGQFCDLIHRDALGTLWLPNQGFVQATNLNLGERQTKGVDIAVNYLHSIGRWGGLGFNFLGTYLDSWKERPVPGGGDYECAGLYGNTCGSPLPEWRHKLRVTWTTPWRGIEVGATWRHVGKVNADTTDPNPLLAGDTEPVVAQLGRRDYLDLAASWAVTKQITLRAGVSNVFDRDPPLTDISGPSIFGNGNTFPGVYDSFGRRIFIGATANF